MRPMLAVRGSLPAADDDDKWAYEFRWDGVRALARVDGGRLTLYSRRGDDITAGYPELWPLGKERAGRQLWLDGEVVAFDEGNPSFVACSAGSTPGRGRRLAPGRQGAGRRLGLRVFRTTPRVSVPQSEADLRSRPC